VINAFFAGPVATDSRELLDAIGRALSGEDPEAPKRRKLLELSLSHRDAGATHRLLEAVDPPRARRVS
jgi:hypothetical protein